MAGAEQVKEKKISLPSLEQIEAIVIRLEGGMGVKGEPFRVPLDPVLGLVPILGDGVTMVMALAIITKARELGAPRSLILRMVGSVSVDFALGSVSVLGDLFDVYYRANRKNLALLKAWLAEREGANSTDGKSP